MGKVRHNQSSFYDNKIILGPMVRVGTLPMRLLALRNGADLVYSEEIIDYKLIKSKRFVNSELNTVDFIDDSGVVVFRTCSEEQSNVVLQIGTNDPQRAVLAAKMVENDVAAIDINMGCPKSFSLKGGMGAALLDKPETIHHILSSLKCNLRIPISCKIRVFEDFDATLQLVRLIEQTGVDALAVHGRTKYERPQHLNRNDYIRAIRNEINIPVIANGGSSEIKCYDDISKFKSVTNASSVMIARSAMKNVSIFNKHKPILDVDQLIIDYLKLAIQYDNNAINSKYCIQQILGNLQEIGKGKQLMGAYELCTMCDIYGLGEFYLETIQKRNFTSNGDVLNEIFVSSDNIELPVVFDKNLFDQKSSPKNLLNEWITKNNTDKAVYQTYSVEKQFHTVIRFLGKTYWTPYLEKTKRHSEQSAALVVIFSLGLCDDTRVIDACIVSEKNKISALQHRHNDKMYLIKINK